MSNKLLDSAKQVILTEAQAVSQLAEKLDQSFVDAKWCFSAVFYGAD